MTEPTDLDELKKYATHAREPFYRIAFDFYRAPGKVLDVGAGAGGFADLLGLGDIYLIEGNPESAEQLRHRYSNVFELRLPAVFPFEDQFFALIHCSHLIEHLYPHELYAVLKEFDRCLAPGGYLVISTPLMWEGFYDDLSHIKPYTPVVLEKYFCAPATPGGSQRTRSAISHGYERLRLVYRLRTNKVPFLNLSYRRRWAQKLVFSLSSWLRSLYLSVYERTGYTIVLRKQPLQL